MSGGFFHTVFYQPIYNLLVFLIDSIPGGNITIAVFLTTIIVRLVLFPLSKKAFQTQLIMKDLMPKMEDLKRKYKDNKEAYAKATMDLYKEKQINPFAGFFLILIQLPVIFALFFIFSRSGLPHINATDLYSFISVPKETSMILFGIFDMSKKSLILAIFAGVAQFIQAQISIPKSPELKDGEERTFQADFARNMNMQARYFLPALMIPTAYFLSAAIAVYFITSSLFSIAQDLYIKKKYVGK
jgi:YidC/Oxa1 family membrane protein insertase